MKMKLQLMLWISLAAAVSSCGVINIVRSDREDLFRGFMPLSLATDPTKDTLYFIYFQVDEMSTLFKTAIMNLKTKEYVDINGVDVSHSLSIDSKTHDLYIGGYRGVYKYNKENGKAELYGSNWTSIGDVYFKDKLYYSDEKSRALYTIVDGNVEQFNDIKQANHFVIDVNNNMFFYNDTGLFVQKIGTNTAFIFTDPENSVFPNVRGLNIDIYGNVYATCDDGIYFVNREKRTLKLKWSVIGANGIAFDSNNNLLYSDIRSIYRVKSSAIENCD